ncbi:MAG: hypothetical protein ACK5G9_06530 [Akkermansiaceae bacterium]
MPKRLSKTAKPDKVIGKDKAEPGEFIRLLKTDIKDLEIGDTLKRLCNIQVNDWEIRRPKRAFGVVETRPTTKAKLSAKKSKARHHEALAEQLKNFLLYVATNLIEDPSSVEIFADEISPGVLRLKLILAQRDLSMLVGRGGDTAEVIRSILKARGREYGVDVLLKVISHEENSALKKIIAKK